MLVYRLVLTLLIGILRLASFAGHGKARKAWRGRHGWEVRLKTAAQRAKALGKTGPWFHLHCASLGEFEQGAPILEQWRKIHPDRPVLLTFFSPSGHEGVDRDAADHVEYLPFDTPANMARFAEALPFSDSVLVKYELWPCMLKMMSQAGIRVHLVAARFDRGRHPMSWTGGMFRRAMQKLTSLQVQDAHSADVAREFGLTCMVTGDPRVDRVINNAQGGLPEEAKPLLEQIESWVGGRPLLVVGSAWPAEWEALSNPETLNLGEWCILWAPHEIEGPHIRRWAQHPSAELWSALQGQPAGASDSNMLILDQIGLLKYAYGLADMAVVGGGWGKGVHNTLEPAAFGVPTLFGPRIQGFREIQGLIDAGAGCMCRTPSELRAQTIFWMQREAERKKAGLAAREWVDARGEAAVKIVGALTSA